MSPFFVRPCALLCLLALAAPSFAQELAPLAPAPAPDDKISLATQDAIAKGQALLDDNNPASVSVLRGAAQSALKALGASAGGNALALPALPDDPLTDRLTPLAIEAHARWGRAADQFGQRDEAITALVRAKTLLAHARVLPDDRLVRDAKSELNALLRGGLPLVAPDDVLDGIATRSHEDMWHARRFDFAPAPAGRSPLDALPKTAFLVTEGQLFPPAQRNQSLVQIPPFYRPKAGLGAEETDAALDRLPGSVKLNRMVAGYERIALGPNAGQWRQTVRVFYASPFLTRANRDDAARAQALAAQFLRVHALFATQLGATNLYSRGEQEGVTTLYLLEISALWPQDDDDPVVLTALGPKMPPINTGPKPKIFVAQPTALMKPWQALAGQTEGTAPGEIMFWKAGYARSEAEWTRELFHEYGHVALPPFGGFKAPLENYGNGSLGETLGMLWAAQNSGALDPSPDFHAGALLHVERVAASARRFFVASDPTAPRLDGSPSDLKFLQGLCVMAERTYGAPLLGRAFAPLSARGAGTQNIAARRALIRTQDLLGSLDAALQTTFAARKSLTLYLPAALNAPLSDAALVARAPVTLKAGERASGWVCVPSGATTLRIDSPTLSVVGTPFKHEGGATLLYFGGKGGWQKLTLVATGDATLWNARFE